MAIVETVNFSSFVDAFRRMNRYEQFGYDALRVLFDYLDDIGKNIELDVIAFCCDYSHDTTEDIAEIYNINIADIGSEDEDEIKDRIRKDRIRKDRVREYLENNTIICGETADGFVYAVF